MNYRIQIGTLGHKYVILVTMDDKENVEPITKIIKEGFNYLERTRKRLQKAIELEEKEKDKISSHGGLF